MGPLQRPYKSRHSPILETTLMFWAVLISKLSQEAFTPITTPTIDAVVKKNTAYLFLVNAARPQAMILNCVHLV